MTRRKQRSCHQCRTRHLKCDGQLPCGHCRKGVRRCTKEDEHIFLNESQKGIVRRRQRYDLTFTGGQRWMDLPTSVTFAGEAAASATSGLEDEEPTASDHVGTDLPVEHVYCPGDGLSAAQQPTPYFAQLPAAFSPAYDPWVPETFQSISTEPAGPVAISSSTSRSSTSDKGWPLKDYREAMLMRYYITNLARWFDGSDKQFTCVVPELAASSPMLLNAILAFSAKHLSLMGKLDEAVSLRYQDACYQALLPDLQQKAFEAEQLVAVILLRLSVQMHEYDGSGESDYSIFLGLDVFLDAWRLNKRSSLHAAIFVNVLRLYMHVAWTKRRSLPAVERNCTWMCDMLPIPNDSALWNTKILMLNARTINYCYDDQPKSPERWMILNALAEDWMARKPACFEPIFHQAPIDGEPFPTIMFAGEVHACSHLYHARVRLLLLNNRPRLATEGGDADDDMTQEQIRDESLAILRDACGVTRSHIESVGVLLLSTTIIAYGGHLLNDRKAQEQAYAVLEEAQKQVAGVTAPSVYAELRAAWVWEPS